ncbi:MAG: hydroxyphenylacetyl-CoA thioesterase PaaI [Pikeienuella sp.]
MDPEKTVAEVVRAMRAGDDAAKMIGLALEEVTPGHARLSLKVERRHAQALGICHGGVIFTLADSAFAYACNSHGAPAVSQHATISYLAPARIGDVLVAEAREVHRAGRSGLYDIDVANQKGETVAVMRGASRTVGDRRREQTEEEG